MNEPANINEAAKAFQALGMVPAIDDGSYSTLLSFLSCSINKMIREDFSGFVQLLYKIDISEQKLKAVLQRHADENSGNVIAAMMIERQLKKMETRKAFNRKNNIAEEDRW